MNRDELETLLKGRELTVEEAMTWGVCPVCYAPPGEYCYPEVGIQLGSKVGGGKPKQGEGTHLARLQSAPNKIKLVEYT